MQSGDGLVDGLDTLAQFMDPVLSGGQGTQRSRALPNSDLLKIYSYVPGEETIRLKTVMPPTARGRGGVEETLTGSVCVCV